MNMKNVHMKEELRSSLRSAVIDVDGNGYSLSGGTKLRERNFLVRQYEWTI